MDLLCPDCRSPLQISGPGSAVCALHGTLFDVLFDRYAVPPTEKPSTAPAGWRRVERTAMCAEHRESLSVADCRLCAKPICATCDFAMPGGVHLCPSCVENSQSSPEVDPRRKRLSYIALGLAAWSTMLIVLIFAGAFNSLFTDDAGGKAADLIVTNLALWPLLIGTGLSMSAMDRRLKSTGIMKVARWWNGILAALFLLFVVLVNLGVVG